MGYQRTTLKPWQPRTLEVMILCHVFANGSKTVRAFLRFLLLGCFVQFPIYMYASMLHLDVAFHTYRLTLHTGLDATLCYAGDVALGGGGLGWGGAC